MDIRGLRWPCAYPVGLWRGPAGRSWQLRNLAGQGAVLAGAGDVGPGDAVVLVLPGGGGTDVDGIHVAGRVRWAAGGQCGVRFAQPLTPEALRAVRRRVGRLPIAQRRAWAPELAEAG